MYSNSRSARASFSWRSKSVNVLSFVLKRIMFYINVKCPIVLEIYSVHWLLQVDRKICRQAFLQRNGFPLAGDVKHTQINLYCWRLSFVCCFACQAHYALKSSSSKWRQKDLIGVGASIRNHLGNWIVNLNGQEYADFILWSCFWNKSLRFSYAGKQFRLLNLII